MALRSARKMKIERLVVVGKLPFIEKNLENLAKWEQKGWSHGVRKGKGNCVGNKEDWIQIKGYIDAMEVDWMFNPQGATHQTVLKAAQSMAILPVN